MLALSLLLDNFSIIRSCISDIIRKKIFFSKNSSSIIFRMYLARVAIFSDEISSSATMLILLSYCALNNFFF